MGEGGGDCLNAERQHNCRCLPARIPDVSAVLQVFSLTANQNVFANAFRASKMRHTHYTPYGCINTLYKLHPPSPLSACDIVDFA